MVPHTYKGPAVEWIEHALTEVKSWSTGLGVILGALGTLTIGVLKTRNDREKNESDHQLGMTREQRLMLEALWAQVQAQNETVSTQTQTIARLQSDIMQQRKYYESKLDDMRHGYQAQISMLKEHVNPDIEIDKRLYQVMEKHIKGEK